MTYYLNEHNKKQNRIVCESLREALIILMNEKNYYKISICELCEKAGVSRMAFYNNYKSKDDLLRQIIYFQTNILIDIVGSPFREKTDTNWYIKMFECIKENNIYLKTIFNANFKFEYLSAINDLVLHDSDINATNKYLRLMWTGGVVNTIIYWIESDMKDSIKEMAEFCYHNLSVWTK